MPFVTTKIVPFLVRLLPAWYIHGLGVVNDTSLLGPMVCAVYGVHGPAGLRLVWKEMLVHPPPNQHLPVTGSGPAGMCAVLSAGGVLLQSWRNPHGLFPSLQQPFLVQVTSFAVLSPAPT
eukprot:m.421587 g.421587  ORF g.421587 m.421587 type:complete len:120 (-) comp21319_c0_seq2:790-1149(-)